MQKQAIWILVLCLAVAGCTGIAAAEEVSATMTVAPPGIIYDGTYLSVVMALAPMTDKYMLVDAFLLDPMAQAHEPDAKEALASGKTLIGVDAMATVYSGDTALLERPLYSGMQDGSAMTRGFHFVLAPETPRDNLTIQVEATLYEAVDTPTGQKLAVELTVPEPLAAEIVSIPADIRMEHDTPDYISLDGEPQPPDWSEIKEVLISSSQEALCVLVRFEGDWRFFSPIYTDAAGTRAEGYGYTALPEADTLDGPHWTVCEFDTIDTLPDMFTLTLEHARLNDITVTLTVDVINQTVALTAE